MMNDELRIKNHESRKRALIPHYSFFIIHSSFFIIHYSLFILHYLIVLHYSLFIYKGKVTLPVSAHVDI